MVGHLDCYFGGTVFMRLPGWIRDYRMERYPSEKFIFISDLA